MGGCAGKCVDSQGPINTQVGVANAAQDVKLVSIFSGDALELYISILQVASAQRGYWS